MTPIFIFFRTVTQESEQARLRSLSRTPAYRSTSFLKSHLQKCVRRSQSEKAIATAYVQSVFVCVRACARVYVFVRVSGWVGGYE